MAASLQGIELSEERVQEILTIAKEWALSHGVGIKVGADPPDNMRFMTASFSLFPSIIPASLYNKAMSSLCHFNRMMHKVALSHEFLEESLKNVIGVDDFTRSLWNIYLQVREKGVKQPLMLGLLRNDFMINCHDQVKANENLDEADLHLKQIEFNTIATSFAGVNERFYPLHRLTLKLAGKNYDTKQMPDNKPSSGMAEGLIMAWELYGNDKAAIAFVVNQRERNGPDQRAMEFDVYDKNPNIKCIFTNMLAFAERGVLNEESGKLTLDGYEIAIIYMRDGYIEANYPTQKHWDGRLKMEMSRAIKCPSIQYHLAGAKKIQQELARPGMVEKFVDDPEIAKMIKETFADQYSLDLGEEGDRAVKLALASPHKYVLKPQREGGGFNLYGDDISKFLTKHATSEERNAYILMERIFPFQQKNYLYKEGRPMPLVDVVNEIGIYGWYLGSTDMKEHGNKPSGTVIKTKESGTDEGGIVAGFAVLDTPFLV